MFADTVAAEAVPAARALAPIAVKVAIRARWRRVELLTSGDPFLAFPEPTARRAVAAGPRSVVVMHTYAGARSLLWPSQVSGPTRPRRATRRAGARAHVRRGTLPNRARCTEVAQAGASHWCRGLRAGARGA